MSPDRLTFGTCVWSGATPLRVGLVGTGTVSRSHLPAYCDHEARELAAVCDADAERAADLAEEFECGTRVDLFATYSASEVPCGESVWLYGDEGVAYDPPGEGAYRDEVRIGTGDGFRALDPDTVLPTDDGFVNELPHFADCVESGTESIASGRDNFGTVAAVFALCESAARDGEWVRPVDLLRAARRGA